MVNSVKNVLNSLLNFANDLSFLIETLNKTKKNLLSNEKKSKDFYLIK